MAPPAGPSIIYIPHGKIEPTGSPGSGGGPDSTHSSVKQALMKPMSRGGGGFKNQPIRWVPYWVGVVLPFGIL